MYATAHRQCARFHENKHFFSDDNLISCQKYHECIHAFKLVILACMRSWRRRMIRNSFQSFSCNLSQSFFQLFLIRNHFTSHKFRRLQLILAKRLAPLGAHKMAFVDTHQYLVEIVFDHAHSCFIDSKSSRGTPRPVALNQLVYICGFLFRVRYWEIVLTYLWNLYSADANTYKKYLRSIYSFVSLSVFHFEEENLQDMRKRRWMIHHAGMVCTYL